MCLYSLSADSPHQIFISYYFHVYIYLIGITKFSVRDYCKDTKENGYLQKQFYMQEKDILNFIQTMLNVASDFAITKIEKAEEKEKIVRIYFKYFT